VELKPGYKQTEVGVIPEDWDHRTLGLLYAEPSRNGIYKTSEYQGRGTRIVNMGEMFGFEFISDQQMSRVTLTNRELSVSGLLDGDLLFGRRSVVPAGAGKCSLVVSLTEPITFESSIIRVRLDKTAAHPRFYYYFFASPTGRSLITAIVSGTTVKGIRATELAKLTVPLPTKAEQEAITEALSDADALIESLEQLLAKRRQLKQGAMQELLTGKRRLPGFSGEWEVKSLGQVAPLQRGFDLSTAKVQPGPFPVVYSNGVLTYHIASQVKAPGVVTGRSGTIGRVTFVERDFWPHNTALWVTSFKGNEPKFVFYLYTWIGLERFATGSGVPTLNRNDVHSFMVSIPATRAEQTAIAAILSDMDAEIAALEAKLAKARALKQGMMQELLTGRIRLV
jgi:Restriction endonuclease S subunits